MFFQTGKKKEDHHYHIEIMQKIKSTLIVLEQHYEATSKQPAQKQIKEICKTTRMILKELAGKSEYAVQLAMFADYYLPETAAITEQYVHIKSNRLQSEKSALLVKEIEAFLVYAEEAFAQILASLALPEARSVSTDIAVLIEELKRKELKQ